MAEAKPGTQSEAWPMMMMRSCVVKVKLRALCTWMAEGDRRMVLAADLGIWNAEADARIMKALTVRTHFIINVVFAKSGIRGDEKAQRCCG